MTQTISVELFGFPTIKRDGIPISFSSQKVLGLCCYLVINQQPCSRDKLMGLLWGDVDEEKARTSLRSALYNIQQQLPDVFEITRKQVSIEANASFEVDVWQFEQGIVSDDPAVQFLAIQHYKVDFLDGLYISAAPDFDHWMLVERERLHRLAVDYLDQILNQASTYGVDAAHKLFSLEPWREDVARYLMRHLARQRNYTSAMKVFQQLRDYIRQELEIEPASQTLHLVARIQKLRNSPHHNLPGNLAPLIGREREREAVIALLIQERTVTLTGMGGIGKTLLALHIAFNQVSTITGFMDGIWLISLIDIQTGVDLPRLVANVLDLPVIDQQNQHDHVINRLREYECLLILDNAEHLLSDGSFARFVQDLRVFAPAVYILITSRQSIRFKGERVYELNGLSIRDTALQLFQVVAQRYTTHFVPSDDETALILEFCHSVEGLPLAIEITASTMSWQSTMALQNDITQLEIRHGDIEHRHRTLDAVITHSWILLNASQQNVLMQLAVIQGRFSAEMAQSIASVDLFVLGQLVDKSLLRHQSGYYSMHEVIRQYALNRMDTEMETFSRNQHCNYFFSLLTTHLPDLQNANFAHTLQYLTEQLPNVVIAWEWAVTQEQVMCFSPALFEALQHLLMDRGYKRVHMELAQQVTELFAMPKHAIHFELRIYAQLIYLYCLNWYARDHEQFSILANTLEQELREQNSSPYLLARCLQLKGWNAQYFQQNIKKATQHFMEAYVLLGDANATHEAVRVLNDIGLVTQEHNRQQAISYWQQALEQAYLLEDPRLEAVLLCNLAETHLAQQHYTEAEQQFLQALALKTEHDGVLLSAYSGLAALYLEIGNLEQALVNAQEALTCASTYHQNEDAVAAYIMLSRILMAMEREKAAKQQLIVALRDAYQAKNQNGIQQITHLLKMF